jgi:23S rRNA-/tRNA-specific pseudouridylate synthase
MSNIPVIYQDSWLLVVDKPSGLLTVPTPNNERRTLVSILNEEMRKPDEPQLFPCHRLDRETSGLIVFAKGRTAEKKMMDLFRSRKIKKTYVAFIQGKVAGHGRITVPVEGSPALTRYHVTRTCRAYSVVKAFPETGRKNQIRIHFKAAGHPIVGESKYAFRKDFALKAKGAMLHAESIEFPHPVTSQLIRLTAPLPPDMQRFLEEHE